jgi:hypothetical protein
MKQFDEFRSILDQKQSEILLRKLSERQAAGELRSERQLRQALEEGLRDLRARGKITLQLPVLPWAKVTAERFKNFFENLGLDVEVLFTEVDHSEAVLQGLAEVVSTQLRNLEFSLGQLRSEVVQRRVRTPPGSGWSAISRDSFDRGYGRLLGRAELAVNLFVDPQTGIVQDKENVPIKADARIEGVAKKLVLPELSNSIIGFKRIEPISGTIQGNISIRNEDTKFKAIDGNPDTFWSHTVANTLPFVGTATAEVTQVAGVSGTLPVINLASIKDPRYQEFMIRITGFSGVTTQYASINSLEDYTGPGCEHDIGGSCRWGYTDFYSLNCTNSNCSRYQPEIYTIADDSADLGNGYGWDTGIDVQFADVSGLCAGQTWRVEVIPSGQVGALLELELTLSKSTNVNWVELDPVIDNPLVVQALEYTEPGNSTRIPIITGTVDVPDKIRFDFPKIEADRLYLTLVQETYEQGNLLLRPRQQAARDLWDAVQRENSPSIDELYTIPTEAILMDYVSNGPARKIFERRTVKPQEIAGYFYQFGIFDINCGFATYADTAVAVTKEVRAVTPRMFGIQPNLEPDISYALTQATGSTVEFDIIRFNYDDNSSLINVDEFPLPDVDTSGIITERLFLRDDKEGLLRFAAESISGIEILNQNQTLGTTEYSTQFEDSDRKQTLVTIDTEEVNLPENSSILVKYTPAYGVYLNSDKSVSIQDNRLQELSVSDVMAIAVADEKTANRKVSYSDVHLRIILRRNIMDTHTTPGLRDYIMLINEGDEERFF